MRVDECCDVHCTSCRICYLKLLRPGDTVPFKPPKYILPLGGIECLLCKSFVCSLCLVWAFPADDAKRLVLTIFKKKKKKKVNLQLAPPLIMQTWAELEKCETRVLQKNCLCLNLFFVFKVKLQVLKFEFHQIKLK